MNKEFISIIKEGKVVAFCGAGISQESGVPTFRDEGGLWEKYNPQVYGTMEGIISLILSQPTKVRDFIVEICQTLIRAKPNYAHFGLKELEERRYLKGIITQNIDDLHYQAGSKDIAEIHGNVYKFICSRCNFSFKKNKEEVVEFINLLKEREKRRDIVREIIKFMGKCSKCGRRMKSSIVFFGQSLPQDEIQKSYLYLKEAKLVLCIGTSGEVYPAAHLPFYAKERGVKLAVINRNSTLLDDVADFIFRETAVDFFKKLLSNL
jgi:NAD-dependent deacetylase